MLGTALVIGELFELRPAGRAALPLSFAVLVVMVPATTPVQYAIIVVLGYAAATAIRITPVEWSSRLFVLVERIAEGFAVRAAYRLVVDATNDGDTRAMALGALAVAAITPISSSDLVTAVRGATDCTAGGSGRGSGVGDQRDAHGRWLCRHRR